MLNHSIILTMVYYKRLLDVDMARCTDSQNGDKFSFGPHFDMTFGLEVVFQITVNSSRTPQAETEYRNVINATAFLQIA